MFYHQHKDELHDQETSGKTNHSVVYRTAIINVQLMIALSGQQRNVLPIKSFFFN